MFNVPAEMNFAMKNATRRLDGKQDSNSAGNHPGGCRFFCGVNP
jgi:hypothetical protein